MERYTEQWFRIETSHSGEGDWRANSNLTFDSPRAARARLRQTRRNIRQWVSGAGGSGYEARIVRVSQTIEEWPERHVKPPHGKCPECGYVGRDCKGADA